jgi:hypothetical protein
LHIITTASCGRFDVITLKVDVACTSCQLHRVGGSM